MPTLAPHMQFDVSAEQPVQQPSALKALSGLIGAGFDAAERIGDAEPNLEAGLVRGLEQAQQLREQGKEAEALGMERRVMMNYNLAGGDTSKERTQEIIRTYTGRAPESVGFSQEEMLAQEIQDPDSELGKAYNRNLLAAQGMLPDGSDEEQHELAMSLIVKEQANEALIAEAQFSWSQSSRGAVLDKINNFGNVSLGALNQVAQSGGTVSLEDIQQVRSTFNQLRAQIIAGRPANVPAAEWKVIEDALQAKADQLQYLEELAGPGNLDARATAELITAIENAGIDDFNGNIMTRIIVDDPSAFLERGVLNASTFNQDMSTVAQYMQDNGPKLSEGATRTGNAWDESVITGANGEPISVEEGLKYAQASTVVMNAVTTDQLLRNPSIRNEYGRAAVRQLSALQGIGEQGGYVSPNDMKKFFSPQFFNQLATLKSVDPELAEAIEARAEAVLGTQLSVIGQKFNSAGQNSFFQFNPNTGEFRVNEALMQQRLDSLPPQVRNTLNDAVADSYNGDWSAALADNGAKINGKAANQAWFSAIGGRTTLSADLKRLGAAYHGATSVLNQFQKMNDTSVKQPMYQSGAEPQLIKYVNQFEGVGDYDTLFGHSQRQGGQFAGISVSNMTLGELKQFQDPSGPYGQWVGRNNPKGAVATPIGKYQYVGTTLHALTKEMGLSDDVVFTPAVQDAIFAYHVNKILRNKPQSEWPKILRGQWDGFNKKDENGNFVLSDQDLVNAGAEFLAMPPQALAYTTRNSAGISSASPLAPTSSPAPRSRADAEVAPEVIQNVAQVQQVDPSVTNQEIDRGRASSAATGAQNERIVQRIMERFNVDEQTAREILREEG